MLTFSEEASHLLETAVNVHPLTVTLIAGQLPQTRSLQLEQAVVPHGNSHIYGYFQTSINKRFYLQNRYWPYVCLNVTRVLR